MTKLLYLVTEAGYFFSHRYIVAKEAQKKGFEVIVATVPGAYRDRLLAEGFRVRTLSHMTRSSLNPLEQLFNLIEIYKIYRKEKPNIVHHVAMKPVLYGTIAARLAGVKGVVNALTGLGYLFVSHSLKARFVRFWVWMAFKVLFKDPRHFLILQNQDDLTLFSKIIPKNNLALIRGSGVNIKKFLPSAQKVRRKRLKVVLVARLLWDKGIKEAIEAVELLKQKDLNLEFILAGGIDLQNPSGITIEEIKKWQKNGLCTWLGQVDDVAKLYKNCDIAILPSYREGLPKSLLEAGACGLPIVTTDVPGCREIVAHQKTGLLVPAKSAPPLAQAIEKLLKDSNLRHKLGQAARIAVEKYFSEEIVVNQTLQLYETLK